MGGCLEHRVACLGCQFFKDLGFKNKWSVHWLRTLRQGLHWT